MHGLVNVVLFTILYSLGLLYHYEISMLVPCAYNNGVITEICEKSVYSN